MKQPTDHTWKPDPHLLAAYLDGELDSRADLAAVRLRVQAWLEQNPHVAAEAQRLHKLWQKTTPPEPCSMTWKIILDRIEGGARQRAAVSASAKPWRTIAASILCLVLLTGLLGAGLFWFSSARPATHPALASQETPGAVESKEVGEVLPVALAEEVTILRVEGEDMATLVVGELPLQGPMEWAAPGEVRVLHVTPDQRDRKLPHVQQDGPNRPLIWARLDTEND